MQATLRSPRRDSQQAEAMWALMKDKTDPYQESPGRIMSSARMTASSTVQQRTTQSRTVKCRALKREMDPKASLASQKIHEKRLPTTGEVFRISLLQLVDKKEFSQNDNGTV